MTNGISAEVNLIYFFVGQRLSRLHSSRIKFTGAWTLWFYCIILSLKMRNQLQPACREGPAVRPVRAWTSSRPFAAVCDGLQWLHQRQNATKSQWNWDRYGKKIWKIQKLPLIYEILGKFTDQFERCAIKCVDSSLSTLPNLFKTIKSVLSRGPQSIPDV